MNNKKLNIRIGDIVEISSYASSKDADRSKNINLSSYLKGTVTKIADGHSDNPYQINNGDAGWCGPEDIKSINGKVVAKRTF